MPTGIGLGISPFIGRKFNWAAYWAAQTQAQYFVDGFDGANILDSSENGLDAISRNTGSFVGDGTAYFTVAGLLTTDVITALSIDLPTCGTNGRLDIANNKVVYGITITRSGSLWAYYPCSEKTGVCLYDVSGNGNHGYMVSGSDANWVVVDLPTTDYLRDYGCSRVIDYDGTLRLAGTYGILKAVNTTDSIKIEIKYKLDAVSGGYIMGGSAYILRVDATTLRYRPNGVNIDFTIAVPICGSLVLEHDGLGKYTATINGGTPVIVNTTAYKLLDIYLFGTNGSTPIKGYFRDLKFTRNGVLILDIPDFYSGFCNVFNLPILTVNAGAISYKYIPANLDGITDADGFTITHPQTGSLAIPGTYFSLPADADLITACAAITLNDYFTGNTPNIIEAGVIGHYQPKTQYYDWYDRDNLIIIKDGVSISDNYDLLKIKELHYWGTYIADDFCLLNSHFSISEKAYYKSIIETLLHPDYIDDAATGYYYTTFGPEGLKRINSGFFILFFHNDDIAAATYTPFSAAQLLTTPRINVGGDIYASALFSNHTYNGTDYIVLSSLDNFNKAGTSDINLTMNIGCLYRQIPNLDRYFHITIMYVSGYDLNIDVTDYKINRSNFKNLVTNYTSIYGIYPTYNHTFIYSQLSVRYTAITGFDITTFNTGLTLIDMRDVPIKTSEISSLLSNLKTYFTANAPINNLTINYYTASALASQIGFIVDGLLNADYLDLIDLFMAEGKTFSVVDEYFAVGNRHKYVSGLSEGCIVFTADDWYAEFYNNALPVFEAKGVKCTLFGTIVYIDDASVGGDTYTHARWGRITTWVENINAYNRGFDMQCHGYVHGSLTAANMILANAAWVSHGIPAPEHIAYPFGGYSDEIIAAIGAYRFTGRTVEQGYNGADSIIMELNCLTLDIALNYEPLNHLQWLKSCIDLAYDEKYALILLAHGMPLTSNAFDFGANDLVKLIDYIQAKGMPIKTIKELYEDEFE